MGERQAKVNEKRQYFKGWETLDNNNNRVTSRKVYTYLLASFTDYLTEQNITSLEVFKQAGINTYKRYLLDKGNSNV